MKLFQILILVVAGLSASAQHTTLAPGSKAPDISLLNVDGKTVSFSDYPLAKGFIVVFTCNTCPYAKAYESRIIALTKKYAPLRFPLIAINPNDPAASPGDAFAKMRIRARAASYPFPYLYDKEQAVTAQYGPRSTPHLFIIAKTDSGNTIRYTGALDNDTADTDPNKIKYAEDAIDALLAGNAPAVTTTKAIGCSVRWKH